MSLTVAKSIIRRFYAFLSDPEGEKVPEIVGWIKVKLPRSATKLPKDLLTPEEVKRLAEACVNPRDRALVMVLYDSAARLSEVCGLRVGDVEFDQYGARITVTGKTGSRKVRLINSVPDLQLWLGHHLRKDIPDAPLFIDLDHAGGDRPLLQDGMSRVVRRAAKTAGIKKRVHPHLFRHSRLTELAKHLSESELKVFAGWTASSQMARVYIHLSGDDVDRKLLEKAGFVRKEGTVRPMALATRECRRCATKNSATARYCSKCSLPFEDAELMQLTKEHEALIDAAPLLLKILKDPDVRRIVDNKALATDWHRQQVAEDQGRMSRHG